MIWKGYVEKDVFQFEILCLLEKVIKKLGLQTKQRLMN